MEDLPVPTPDKNDKKDVPTHQNILALAELLKGNRIRLNVFPNPGNGLDHIERDVRPEELPGITFEHTDRLLRLDVIIERSAEGREEIVKIVNIRRPENKV